MRYAHNATTGPRTVHSLAELRMALEDKARGQRLAQMRKLRRLTQQQMCEKLGVAYRTYQTWEAGTMPEWPNVEKIATFFEIRPEDWIGEDDIVLSAAKPGEPTQLDRIEAKLDRLLELLGDGDIAGPFVESIVSELESRGVGDRPAADPPGGGSKPRSGASPAAPGARAPKKRRA